MQITFDHTDLANPACRRILAALLDRDEPEQLALDLEPPAPAPTAPDGTDEPTEPPATSAPTEPPAPVFDLDADGAVWDARLHSSSRTKTADGRWKKRRGSADLPPPAPAATLAPTEPPPAPAATLAPAEPVIPWGDAPAAPPAPAATPAPAPVDASAFPSFMRHVAKLQAAKMSPMVTLLEIIKRHGFATLIELSKHPEAIPAVMADLPGLPEAQS